MKIFKRQMEISLNLIVLRRKSLARRRDSNPHQHLLSCLFYYSHSGECEVISHCGFIFHITNDVKHLLQCLLAFTYLFQ